jgi:hypothetical protein
MLGSAGECEADFERPSFDVSLHYAAVNVGPFVRILDKTLVLGICILSDG